jgi:hypothetical protein
MLLFLIGEIEQISKIGTPAEGFMVIYLPV